MATDIFQLINAGENVELECKEAGQGLPKDLWETYSSFANSNGGIILLGVKQKGNIFTVSGVDSSKRLKEFWDLINNPQKVNYNLLNDNRLSDKEFLYQIGAWGSIRGTDKEGLTVAGLLMFGYERAIIEEFPHYFLEFREKNSKDIALRWDYRTTSSDGTWSGNLYDFYFKIINRLTDNINIPFKLDGYTRQDDFLYC